MSEGNVTNYVFREANMPEPVEKVRANNRVWWGEDNLYPQFLNRLYYENPVHGGIINQKVKFITSGGLSVENGDAATLENKGGAYTLTEIVDSVCRDLEIGETQTWWFKKNPATGRWCADIMDYELIRVMETDQFFEYSEDWSKGAQTPKQTGYRLIKNIHYLSEDDTECVMRYVTRPKQRNFVEDEKGRVKGLTANYYPTVNYSGAITDLLSSIEMSFFTYSEVVNGWKGGTLINLANGRPTDPEVQKRIEKELKLSSTDRNKQGGMAITYSDGKDREPKVYQVNGNDLDKRYEQAKKTARDNIMVAHGVISPALFGIFTESMFGSKEEMETAYLLFKENYVEVRQRQLINPLNWALRKLNSFQGTIVFNDFIPSILRKPTAEPVKMAAEEQDDTALVVAEFSKFGVSRGSKKILYSENYEAYDADNEEDFKRNFAKSKFAASLTERQKVIVKMIDDGESYDAIRRALEIEGRELSNELIRLGQLGVLDGWKVTDKAKETIVSDAEVQVLYSYELKPTAPPLVAGGKSRPFCTTLIALDRLYTRQEIDTISENVDRDVWRYRGGWYHNPETDRNTPNCRHTWKQNITIDL